jgi:hypothetical protein
MLNHEAKRKALTTARDRMQLAIEHVLKDFIGVEAATIVKFVDDADLVWISTYKSDDPLDMFSAAFYSALFRMMMDSEPEDARKEFNIVIETLNEIKQAYEDNEERIRH